MTRQLAIFRASRPCIDVWPELLGIGTSAPNWLGATPQPIVGAKNSPVSQMVLECKYGYQTVCLD